MDISSNTTWASNSGPSIGPVLVSYVLLYLGTVMFYWWPVAQLVRALWFLYAAFFALGTCLNIISHLLI